MSPSIINLSKQSRPADGSRFVVSKRGAQKLRLIIGKETIQEGDILIYCDNGNLLTTTHDSNYYLKLRKEDSGENIPVHKNADLFTEILPPAISNERE